MRGATYWFIEAGEGAGRAIQCLRCGRISYNLNDVAQRYCGHCGIFHDDAAEFSPEVSPEFSPAELAEFKRLVMEHRYVKASWLKLRAQLPDDLEDGIVEMARNSFFSGAARLFMVVCAIADLPEEDDALEWIGALQQELIGWSDEWTELTRTRN